MSSFDETANRFHLPWLHLRILGVNIAKMVPSIGLEPILEGFYVLEGADRSDIKRGKFTAASRVLATGEVLPTSIIGITVSRRPK